MLMCKLESVSFYAVAHIQQMGVEWRWDALRFAINYHFRVFHRSVYTGIGNRFWESEQSSLRSKFVFSSSCYKHELLGPLISSVIPFTFSLVTLWSPLPSSFTSPSSPSFRLIFVWSSIISSVPLCAGDDELVSSIDGMAINSHRSPSDWHLSALSMLSVWLKRLLLLVLLHELLLGTVASFTIQPIAWLFVVIASLDDLRLFVILLLVQCVWLILFKLWLLLFMVEKLLLLWLLLLVATTLLASERCSCCCCRCGSVLFQHNADVAGGDVANADIDIWSRNDADIILRLARCGSKFVSKLVKLTVCVAISANLTHPFSPLARDANNDRERVNHKITWEMHYFVYH